MYFYVRNVRLVHPLIVLCITIFWMQQSSASLSSRQILLSVVGQSWKLGYDLYAGAEFGFSVLEKSSGDFCDLPHDLSDKICVDLTAVGARLTKADVAGQYTVVVPLGRVCDVADKLFELKTLVRSCFSQEHTVTLMPFVRHGNAGNGLKMAWYLFDILEQKNVCEVQGAAQEELSLRAQQSIAGILSVLRDISVLLNPTINSYKRLKCSMCTGSMAVAWSCGESPVALNFVTNWAGCGQSALVLTTADMCADPCLAYAAISRAALEGVQYSTEMPQAWADAAQDNHSDMTSSGKIHQLPTSLAQAIQIAETSDFLRDWLGEALDLYLAEKRKEVAEYESTVTDWEFKKYA
jgi:glutamine synthetase